MIPNQSQIFRATQRKNKQTKSNILFRHWHHCKQVHELKVPFEHPDVKRSRDFLIFTVLGSNWRFRHFEDDCRSVRTEEENIGLSYKVKKRKL